MKRKDSALRSKLLKLSREIADTDGIEAVNIRLIAQKAGVAIGTVYNYFSGKDEILFALTEDDWKKALCEMKTAISAETFCEQLQEIFYFLKERIDQSAGKLMNSLGTMELPGQERMTSMQSELEAAFIQYMEQDVDIRPNIWNETFTPKRFAHFIMINMSALLKEENPNISFFIAIVKRIVY
jgi:AcrR family transcriptional regulator